jgi:hypothetical protein
MLEVVGSPDLDRDREFTFADYSTGSVYCGYEANLKVFGRALTAEEIAHRPGATISARRAHDDAGYPWAGRRFCPLEGAQAACWAAEPFSRRSAHIRREASFIP